MSEEKEILKFIQKYLRDADLICSTLKKLTTLLSKNKDKITSKWIIPETNGMLVAAFIHYGKLSTIAQAYKFKKEISIANKACENIDKLVSKHESVLGLDGELARGMTKILEKRFSREGGFEDSVLFIDSIRKISKTNMNIETLEKKWKNLILF